MTSQDAQLSALMAAIGPSGEGEAEFFRELLTSTVYAHIPPSDDSGRLRFIQFISPEGETLLPFFTDRAKAEFASKEHARIVTMSGRELFSITLGATLVLNPNDRWCKLYPQELLALLERGDMPPVDITDLSSNQPTGFSRAQSLEPEEMEALREAIVDVGDVQKAYLIEMQTAQSTSPETVLVLILPKHHDDRVCRSLVAVLQGTGPRRGSPTGIISLDPTAEHPSWLKAEGILIYDTSLALN